MLLAVMLLTGIVLTACSSKEGSEFVGVWQEATPHPGDVPVTDKIKERSKNNWKFEISRSGNQFKVVRMDHDGTKSQVELAEGAYSEGRIMDKNKTFTALRYYSENDTIQIEGESAKWFRVEKLRK